MNYRIEKQQKIDNKLGKYKENPCIEDIENFEDSDLPQDTKEDPFFQYPENMRIKEIQYFMNQKNKSKKFFMLNMDASVRQKYLKASNECPLALNVFYFLITKKQKDNTCEISQREIASQLEIALSDIEIAMKYLYKENFVCLLQKKDMPNIKFFRKELKHVYFLNMNLVWDAAQAYKKDIIELIPDEFRCYKKFKKFCTVDNHVAMQKILIDLMKENKHAFCLFFVMAFFMNTKNRYFTSIKNIKQKIDKSLKYVLKLLEILKNNGLIKEDEKCFLINSTVVWNRNQTRTFENDIANIFEQKVKRFRRYLRERREISAMYLREKKEMYLNNTLYTSFI